MFDALVIFKKEIGELKISLTNPLSLTCDKITQTPRVFNTSQIKDATQNVLISNTETNDIPRIIISVCEYLLKDFFLYMHQTGLYNRQFKLWRTLANITSISAFNLQKGLFNKQNLEAYILDFFIDPRKPCVSAIINENTKTVVPSYSLWHSEFEKYLSRALSNSNVDRLKGIFYFISNNLDDNFQSKLKTITDAFDPISKYESKLLHTKDIRLNVINFNLKDRDYSFKHLYPDLSLNTYMELALENK